MKNLASSIEPLESRIAPAAIVVTSLADNGPGTLRAALLTASATSATVDTITFKLPTAPAHSENIINLTTGPLDSTGNVNIVGPGAGKLIINGGGNFRVFDITDDAVAGRGDNVDSPVSISGLSIVDGKVGAPGAGIFSTESLTLKSVVVSGNTVTGTGASSYGGVAVDGNAQLTKVSISNSLITGNSADIAGGMHIMGIKSLSLVKSVISDNTATLFVGGAYISSESVPAVVTVTGSTFAGNTVGSGGLGADGLFIAVGGTAAISSTKITGNSGGVLGGGLVLNGHEGKTVITGSLISANSTEYSGAGVTDTAGGNIVTGTTPVSLTISKSTISGNRTTAASTTALGGAGVYIQGTDSGTNAYLPVTITSSIISSNISARDGGGLVMTKGVAATISACTISGNSAATGGGGIATAGTGDARVNLTIKGGVISSNFVNTSGSGGGILAKGDGTLSLTSTLLTGNVAGGGGGIYVANTLVSATPTVTLKNVTETNNVGGAFTSNSITSPFSITGGSMKGNAAFNGAAVFNAGDAGSIIGTIISGNVAAGKGGGVYAVSTVNAADFTVQIAKVTGNTAPIDPDVFGPMTYV
jgi:fibronectin-binding autotransporter adhesin